MAMGSILVFLSSFRRQQATWFEQNCTALANPQCNPFIAELHSTPPLPLNQTRNGSCKRRRSAASRAAQVRAASTRGKVPKHCVLAVDAARAQPGATAHYPVRPQRRPRCHTGANVNQLEQGPHEAVPQEGPQGNGGSPCRSERPCTQRPKTPNACVHRSSS